MTSSIQFTSSIVKTAYQNKQTSGQVDWDAAARTCNGAAWSFAFDAVKFLSQGKYDYLADQIQDAKNLDKAMRAAARDPDTIREVIIESDGALLTSQPFDFIDHNNESHKLQLSQFRDNLTLLEVASDGAMSVAFERDNVTFDDLRSGDPYQSSVGNKSTKAGPLAGFDCNRLFNVFDELSVEAFDPKLIINQIRPAGDKVIVVVGKADDRTEIKVEKVTVVIRQSDGKRHGYLLEQNKGGIQISEILVKLGEQNQKDPNSEIEKETFTPIIFIENLTFDEVKSQYECVEGMKQDPMLLGAFKYF